MSPKEIRIWTKIKFKYHCSDICMSDQDYAIESCFSLSINWLCAGSHFGSVISFPVSWRSLGLCHQPHVPLGSCPIWWRLVHSFGRQPPQTVAVYICYRLVGILFCFHLCGNFSSFRSNIATKRSALVGAIWHSNSQMMWGKVIVCYDVSTGIEVRGRPTV